MIPPACPEKTLYSTYWAEDNLPDGLQSAGKMDGGISDLVILSSCSGSHMLTGEKKPILGSNYPFFGTDRPLFFENRPLSFTDRLIWPRIGCLMPLTCPEKTAFSTFCVADNSKNGLYVEGGGGRTIEVAVLSGVRQSPRFESDFPHRLDEVS